MPELYKWRVTLKDGTIKEEDKDKFDLAWEEEGSTKKIELIGEKEFNCNLETGEFNIDGEISCPANVNGPKKLYFRKRKQIRTDGQNLLDARTKYLFGYEVNGKLHVASIQPEMGMMEEQIAMPQSQKYVEVPKQLGDFRLELINLKGIGPKTADFIIKHIAKSKEELAKVPKKILIDKLRDDVVDVLIKYLGG